jgi:hypothetical protein
VAHSGLAKPFALLSALALLLVALAAVTVDGAAAGPATASPLTRYALDGEPGAGRVNRVAAATITWRGGPTVTSTGETVNVYVSEALPFESEPVGGWAEFVGRLTHGREITALTSYVATFAEVQQVCGTQALGCYGQNEMISIGEPFEGTPAEEVVRHEYGHHVGFHRLNTPWEAIDWGPKHWSSAADVCGRVARGQAFPGNGGANYSLNPGEAWAEVYRLMDERKAGITTATWPIISQTFFPDEAELLAAERDVLQPWVRGSVTTARRVFGKRTPKVWTFPLSTPLDGELRLTASVPQNALYDVALVSNGRVLKRAQWVSQRAKRLTTTVCGQRSLSVRVTQRGGLGRVTVSVSAP